jgi:hypothetical protein
MRSKGGVSDPSALHATSLFLFGSGSDRLVEAQSRGEKCYSGRVGYHAIHARYTYVLGYFDPNRALARDRSLRLSPVPHGGCRHKSSWRGVNTACPSCDVGVEICSLQI